MILVIDLPFYNMKSDMEYIERFGLPKDIKVLNNISGNEILGKEDRVIYITNLDNGGEKYQRDFLRINKAVTEWFVYSENTEDYLLENYRIGVANDTAGKVRLFAQDEILIQALKKPQVRKNTCLLCVADEGIAAEDIQQMLKEELPGWEFETADLRENPDILENHTCSQVLLLRKKKGKHFSIIQVPRDQKMLVVLVNAEVYSRRDIPQLQREVFWSVEGISWGQKIQSENFYSVSTIYEKWRKENLAGRLAADVLAKDERFVMADDFGLPCMLSDYTQEKILDYLAEFDGFARIAEKMKTEG